MQLLISLKLSKKEESNQWKSPIEKRRQASGPDFLLNPRLSSTVFIHTNKFLLLCILITFSSFDQISLTDHQSHSQPQLRFRVTGERKVVPGRTERKSQGGQSRVKWIIPVKTEWSLRKDTGNWSSTIKIACLELFGTSAHCSRPPLPLPHTHVFEEENTSLPRNWPGKKNSWKWRVIQVTTEDRDKEEPVSQHRGLSLKSLC